MELLPCPFCGAGETSIRKNGCVWVGMGYTAPVSVSVVHHCDEIPGQPSHMIERIGRDEESAIAEWNRRASPASVSEGWKPLTDVQWMNIVNLNHAWENVEKEDAINEVVKLVEARCKANNLATPSAVACLQSMCEESLAPDVYEMWLQVKAALITTRKSLAAAPTPPVSEDRWLPIETAPKDRFVLLAGPSGYTTIETVFATGRMCSDYHVGRWIDHANDDLADWGFEPTHWMPLPEAPTMQEDKL